jgi:excinuclease ABC subunit B
MYEGDASRKRTLVEHGFRLPSALDNRPLRWNEFLERVGQKVFLSATPGPYELTKVENDVVEQVIRPTGLVDPQIIIKPIKGQIDDLLLEINKRAELNERVLVTTLTKKMSEDLTDYLQGRGVRVRYLHSEVDTLRRVELLRELRNGEYDVLIGINLLREGLDLPEVSLVAILDADKEGFLRSDRALIQTIGRAARNSEGRVIMYADKMTDSMSRTIDETNRRRIKQIKYNEEHGITPTTVKKSREAIIKQTSVMDFKDGVQQPYIEKDINSFAADPILQYMTQAELKATIDKSKKEMEKASKDLDFIMAAKWRDDMYALEHVYNEKFTNI